MNITRLRAVLKGGRVRRFHTHTLLKCEDVAAHSFYVAWFVELLTDGKASKEMLLAALAHDLAEQEIGDVPSPTKRKLPEFKSMEQAFDRAHSFDYVLNQPERRVLKLADCFAGMVKCIQEKQLGNSTLWDVFATYYEYALCEALTTDEKLMLNYFTAEFQDVKSK